MSTSPLKPVLFLVHGAWMGSSSFSSIIPALRNAGYPTWAHELPCHNGDPNSDAEETANFVRNELLRIFEAGRDVITVCWSFGGVIAPPGFEGLWKAEREKQGQEHGIIGMVFACTPLAQRAGITATQNGVEWENTTWFGGGNPLEVFNPVSSTSITRSQLLRHTAQGPLITIKTGRDSPFARAMYATLPSAPHPSEVFDPVLRPLSAKAHNTPLGSVPHIKTNTEDEVGGFPVPTAYFLAEQDKVIPTLVQEKVVGRWQEKWAKVYRFDCGHVIWAAQPEEVVNALKDFAEGVVVV